MECQTVDEAMALMKMEYLEMPELKLTFVQARRLWNLSADVCESALGSLVRSKFLVITREGSYLRRSLPSIGLDQTPL